MIICESTILRQSVIIKAAELMKMMAAMVLQYCHQRMRLSGNLILILECRDNEETVNELLLVAEVVVVFGIHQTITDTFS